MKEFKHAFRVKAPLEQVARFHSDSLTLKMLTPPPLRVKINKVEPLAEGSTADFVIWMGPIPVHWAAKHSEVNPTAGFTDTQIRGPFRYWKHRHSFNFIDEGTTEVRDYIQAEFSRQPYRRMLCRMMWINLPVLFAYRAWKTKREIEK